MTPTLVRNPCRESRFLIEKDLYHLVTDIALDENESVVIDSDSGAESM